MHAFNRGGAGGRRQPTPTNVQCQKCLKRGHYSYECKAQLQERPYKARPSRTQQLLNPKLAPKLTNDAPDDATRKKGVADEELAKKEAERARKRELNDDDEEELAAQVPEAKRRRSRSVESVSSISTRSARSSPPRRRASPPPRRARDLSPPERPLSRSRSRSFDSVSADSRRRSPTPETTYRASDRRPRSFSPGVESAPQKSVREHSFDREPSPPQHRRYSRGSRGDRAARPQRQFESRSPGRPDPKDRRRADEGGYARHRDRSRSRDRVGLVRGQESQATPPRQPAPPRQRSLSPFSKRLALTQAMNMGR